MADETESLDYSPTEISEMQYAYRQLLEDDPDRFPEISDKQQLARSVLNSLNTIRLHPTKDLAEMVAVIMSDGAE